MTKLQTTVSPLNDVKQTICSRGNWATSFLTVTAILLGGANSAFAMHPACTLASADADGDGWGWENDRSCLVSVDSAPASNADTSTGNSGLPICANAGSDADGDGYGWENEASCIVAASTQVNNPSSAETPSADTGESTKPACANSSSDPDGDGYGWENDRSCLVTADSATAPNNTGDGPTPVSDLSQPLKFMAMGDSITHGVARNSAKSYRHDFTNLLSAAGCSYTMVGSQRGNLGHDTFVSAHEGYNGHRADHFLTGLNNFAGNNEGVSVAVNRDKPDLVLVHLGTNDMLQGQNVEDTVAEIDQVVSIILDAGADVLLANVVPVFGYGAQTRTQQLGNQLQSYVAQLADSRVNIVDVRSGFTNAMMLSDNLHPNPAGEAHIARAFFNAVQNSGKCLRR